MRNLRYFWYVIRHKWFVLLACARLGVFWRGLVHDNSKFKRDEWRPYRDNFYGLKPVPPEVKEAFDRAWLHHQHRNPHHWQYWLLRRDDGTVEALKMPEKDVLEMVADWMGAGRAITGKVEVWSWYEKNKDKMQLHPVTRGQVEDLLLMLRPPGPKLEALYG
jgi:hypothetical protein